MAFAFPFPLRAAPSMVHKSPRSEHYELTKLVDGELRGLFTVEGQPGFVVVADHHFLRFDDQGNLVDLVRTESVDDNGNSFEILPSDPSAESWSVHRGDWLVSGDRTFHPLPMVSLAEGETARLDSLAQRADQVAPLYATSSPSGRFRGMALRIDGIWTAYDLSSWKDSEWGSKDLRTETVKDRSSELWMVHRWGRHPRPSLLQRPRPGTGDSTRVVFRDLGFSPRSVQFHEGFPLWLFWKTIGWWLLAGLPGQSPYAYLGGVGTFAIHHGGEDLSFRATASWGDDGPGVNSENQVLLELPGGTKLLRLYPPGAIHNEYYTQDGLTDAAHDEVGLYVVRPRPVVGPHDLPASWLPTVSGLAWSTWRYPTGRVRFSGNEPSVRSFALAPPSVSESQMGLRRGGRVLPQPIRQIPTSLEFHLPVSHASYPAAFCLRLDADRWAFLDHDEQEIVLEAKVDSSAFKSAWHRLNPRQARLELSFVRTPLPLNDEDTTTAWYSPALELVDGKRREPLGECRWEAPLDRVPRDFRAQVRYLWSLGSQAGILAREGKITPQRWMEVASLVLQNQEVLESRALRLVFDANEILNLHSRTPDDPVAPRLIDFWIDTLYPRVQALAGVDLAKARETLTSNSLGLCLIRKDTAKAHRIVSDLVGSDPETYGHNTLHYNLACYHAMLGNRPELLAATRRALVREKPVSRFRDDPDFAPWFSDPDFAGLLDSFERR